MKRYEKLIKDPLAREEEILAFWREEGTFEKSLAQTAGAPRYVFYEGPPTANGKPHFGHLMPRVYKDLFPRYKTMKGYYVGRKGGWDTHGLPVELEVEKEIGVNSKPEIEEYGVERFVEHCKRSVWRYKAEWERMIERMGFWIDLENAYVTYTDEYIETLWWELKAMFDRGLLYQGHKTLPYCPRCGTGLSSHEVAQGYRSVEDPSVSVRMPLLSDRDSEYKRQGEDPVSLLTWTTTPWTLPANVALAIAADAQYVEIETADEHLILAKSLVDAVIEGDYRILREFPGEALIGLRYEPLYRLSDDPVAYRVYPADFVNLEDGTGIVHIASAFGEDDYRLGQEVGLPFVQPVDLAGRFTEDFPLCSGEFVKDADRAIIADLDRRGLLYRYAPYVHDYPFCWRCGTPLLYYAMDSWYIRTTAVKDEMIAHNRTINWYPPHVGEGRLGDFLANLKDWALSRERYWGTPLNLWVCEDCGEVTAIGSRSELVKRALDPELAAKVELHRPYVDRVDIKCAKCGGTAHRVPYVIDTWFDSGSMHTAQWHYPFENEELFKENFPADFICEAMEQTRGWFYTLLATSTIVHGQAPYRNCVSTGLGLDEQGVKMSKSKGNVIDPWDLIDKYGADSIRWYLYSSSAPWKSKRLGDANVKEPLYRFIDTVRNTYDFFALYASIDGYDPEVHTASERALTVLDRWIRSRFAATAAAVNEALDGYDVASATVALETLVDDLSNWYVRLSRRRFWRGGLEDDKKAAYATLYEGLIGLSKLLAPFLPFLAEAIYRRLRRSTDPESVHLCRYPEGGEFPRDLELEEGMTLVRRIVALGHQARNRAEVKVRQPLSRVIVEVQGKLGVDLARLIETELNVEQVELVSSLDRYFTDEPLPNFRSLGPRLGRLGKVAGAWIAAQRPEDLRQLLAGGEATVKIGKETVTLLSSDVTYRPAVPAGLLLAQEGEQRLLLDTSIDERLRRKGIVRELIHRIQLARKEAGFEVTDRIVLAYEVKGDLAEIIASHEAEIASEVLATKVVSGPSDSEPEKRQTILLGDDSIEIGLSRVQPDEEG